MPVLRRLVLVIALVLACNPAPLPMVFLSGASEAKRRASEMLRTEVDRRTALLGKRKNSTWTMNKVDLVTLA